MKPSRSPSPEAAPAHGVGHNNGPTMEPGAGWRKHCWTEARRALLPHLPLEVVRLRVKRAREIGLDYKTYANVRAASGMDIVAFLFSSNALRLRRVGDVAASDRCARLATLENCASLLLAHRPLAAGPVAAEIEARHRVALAFAGEAPPFTAGWSELRRSVRAALGPGAIPPRGVVVVGETWAEREWSVAGRLAGFLPAERIFSSAAS